MTVEPNGWLQVSLDGVAQFYQLAAPAAAGALPAHGAYATYVGKVQSLLALLGSVPFHQVHFR